MQAIYKSYYTKSNILVNYMVDMLSVKPGMRIFEPCAGDGVFIDAITKKTSDACIDAIELNPDAFSFLKKKYAQSKDIQIRNCDTLFDEELILYAGMGGIYDRIIANPPYGGWQDFDRRKDLKKLYPGLYVKETYALFLYRCIQLLADKGKLVFIIPEPFLNLHSHTKLREYLLTRTQIREILLFPSSFFPNVHFGYSNLSIITLEKSESRDECLNNQFRVCTGFRKVEEIATIPKYNGQVFRFTQNEVYNQPNHALFVTDNRITTHLSTCECKVGDIADCVTGIYSGNDKKHLHPISSDIKNSKNYSPVDKHHICHDYSNIPQILNGIEAPACFLPVVKGSCLD